MESETSSQTIDQRFAAPRKRARSPAPAGRDPDAQQGAPRKAPRCFSSRPSIMAPMRPETRQRQYQLEHAGMLALIVALEKMEAVSCTGSGGRPLRANGLEAALVLLAELNALERCVRRGSFRGKGGLCAFATEVDAMLRDLLQHCKRGGGPDPTAFAFADALMLTFEAKLDALKSLVLTAGLDHHLTAAHVEGAVQKAHPGACRVRSRSH